MPCWKPGITCTVPGWAGKACAPSPKPDGQWVALLVFSGAAPHTKARECKIRWTPRQRARRLCLAVNNSRFWVWPERQRHPNLASRVLGLGLKRRTADGQAHWGHPVVLVASCVDERQYRGTCYRACGFQAVGLTAGFGRSSRAYYEEHGVPKQLYVRALGLLRQGPSPAALAGHAEKNGAHYRRDVSLGEDACRVAQRTGAVCPGHLEEPALGTLRTASAPGQDPGPHLRGRAAQADPPPKGPTYYPNPMNSS